MNAKQYMHNIRQIRRRIRLLEEQIERDTILAAGVGAIRYDKINVQTSPVADRMADIVAKIIETTAKLKEEIHNLQIHEEELIGILCQLKEEHERVLTYHYLDGVSWSEVADRMGYEEHYIYEIKNNALIEMDKLLNNLNES